MTFSRIFQIFGTGIDETSILLILIVFDSILGTTWRFRKKKQLISQTALSGLMRNVSSALLPSLLELIKTYLHHNFLIFSIVNAFITFLIGVSLFQSILANAKLNGINLPNFIEKIFGDAIVIEIRSKEKRR